MNVEVLLFASARDRVGCSRLALSLGEGARLGSVLDAPELAALSPLRGSLRLALNERFRPESEALSPGDVVAVIPPVSGG